MKSRTRLVVISNLYPLPWEPERATFNRQQFAQLEDAFEMSVLVPVSFIVWFKNIRQIKQSATLRYVPYFFTPKFGRRFYSYFMYLSLLLHSGLWIRRHKPEIILASWAFPDAVASSWLAKLYRCRFFFKVHGSDIHLHGEEEARARQIVAAAKQAKGVISVSAELKQQMVQLGIARDKIHVVYNGVDHNLFSQKCERPIPENYLLFVGNLKKDKGVMELLQAFGEVSLRYPKLKLLVAGRGDMRQSMEQYLCGQVFRDKVELLGSVAHSVLPQLMQHAELLVLPSYHEGVPNVLLEAMAAGTPVVASAVGGIPEVVKPELSGLLVPSADAAALTQTLILALQKDWCRSDIVQHASQFTWQENKHRLQCLLNESNFNA
ncbi:glycosyltransferase [Rheinheimera baltica]|uniref:glycosyltransferase n=1 Tax=Rheinheimera baltica TaxID=67576 RepID=UPI0004850F1D|nr:glycosyltransferase [Rheinheimera baltica]MDP5141549.1 glycosyltransferase [Rheinheimera baltica]MDP5148785.1 glycosyltransferase [Rheinheimera baltica]MDP5191828.1 glycosyltransferase [Rheinheimera baltica]